MSIFIYCFLFITLSVINVSKTITKSVTLTPINNYDNGVTVDTTDLNVITTSNAWNINTINNNNWQLHISMNESWNFLSTQQSTITLKTYINSTTTTPNKDFIFIFSQNTNKYISSTIKTNNNSLHNGLYPHCTSTNNVANTLLATGNINVILNDNDESRDRKYKLTQGTDYNTIPINTDTHTTNTSTFTIQLINNPINQWSKYISTNQQCQFEPFSTDSPIDIYISSADIGQIIEINKLEISFTFSETAESETDTKTTSVQTNENKDKINQSSETETESDSFLESNTEFIIIILILITVILTIVCIALIFMVRKQSIENQKAENHLDLSVNIEMGPKMGPNKDGRLTAAELVLHTSTFKNEETSKNNYSFESRTSFASQITDYHGFGANVAIAQNAKGVQAVVNMDNDNEGCCDNSDDDNDVVMDMIVTAGQ